MTVTIPEQRSGGERPEHYFSEDERCGLVKWRRIVATLPPMAPDEIESAALALNELAALARETE